MMKEWVVRLNAASKALMQKWVRKARAVIIDKQGDALIEDRRSHEAEQAVKVRKIEDDLRKFTEEKQGGIDQKRADFEVQMEEDMEKVVDSADKRVQELMQMRKEKEIEFAQE